MTYFDKALNLLDGPRWKETVGEWRHVRDARTGNTILHRILADPPGPERNKRLLKLSLVASELMEKPNHLGQTAKTLLQPQMLLGVQHFVNNEIDDNLFKTRFDGEETDKQYLFLRFLEGILYNEAYKYQKKLSKKERFTYNDIKRKQLDEFFRDSENTAYGETIYLLYHKIYSPNQEIYKDENKIKETFAGVVGILKDILINKTLDESKYLDRSVYGFALVFLVFSRFVKIPDVFRSDNFLKKLFQNEDILIIVIEKLKNLPYELIYKGIRLDVDLGIVFDLPERHAKEIVSGFLKEVDYVKSLMKEWPRMDEYKKFKDEKREKMKIKKSKEATIKKWLKGLHLTKPEEELQKALEVENWFDQIERDKTRDEFEEWIMYFEDLILEKIIAAGLFIIAKVFVDRDVCLSESLIETLFANPLAPKDLKETLILKGLEPQSYIDQQKEFEKECGGWTIEELQERVDEIDDLKLTYFLNSRSDFLQTFLFFIPIVNADIYESDNPKQNYNRKLKIKKLFEKIFVGDNLKYIDKKDGRGFSYLSLSIRGNLIELAKLLINLGCKIEREGILGVHPIHLAYKRGDEELINLIKEKVPNAESIKDNEKDGIHEWKNGKIDMPYSWRENTSVVV